MAFAGHKGNITGTVDLRGAQIDKDANENKFAGVMFNIGHANIDPNILSATNSPKLDEEQQKFAQKVSLDSFNQDLGRHLKFNKKAVVIILDSYEKCPESLQDWLLKDFFNTYVFDSVPYKRKLGVVVAGQSVPSFESHWSQNDCSTYVKPIDILGKWDEEDIQECLQIYGLPDDKKSSIL